MLSAIAIVVAAGVAATTIGPSGNNDQGSILTATFSDAWPIVAGNRVKAAGVDIGTVESVRLQGGRAVVQMKIQDALRPLHKDARATIQSKNLLGERFISIDPGSPDAPELGEPAMIDTAHTSRDVDLQEVLNSLDTPTSTALGALLTSLGEGVDGNGEQVAGAIKALAPAMQQSGELAQILDEQNSLLTRLVDQAQPVANALASDHGSDLDKLVDSSTQTMTAVAAQRQAVDDSIRQLPATLVQARATLARLSGVADPTTATLSSLRPVTDELTDMSSELRQFSEAADPALASLQPVLDRGNAMLDEAAPLVHSLLPAGGELRDVAQSGRQLAENVLGDHLTQLMEFMKGWALATSDYDAISHYFKAILPISPSPVLRAVAGPVPGLPDNPAPNLTLPVLPRLPLPGRAGDSSDGNSATGLTQSQENSLLGQLLGGL
ncbi:MlaD family protein [Candidatus Protofrankia californiensis]|uniref:MlaD family protein n=1 Tax=Candidatus Protofrankia californiensis TaxID=1839754 RepID=UPI0013ECF1EC|nr:MlaD family protein [Candidatus Protofrankia californiensis]